MTTLASTKTVRLSRRLSVTITVSRLGMVCEWSPGMPNKLTPKELARYRVARDAVVSEAAERLGGSALIVEL